MYRIQDKGGWGIFLSSVSKSQRGNDAMFNIAARHNGFDASDYYSGRAKFAFKDLKGLQRCVSRQDLEALINDGFELFEVKCGSVSPVDDEQVVFDAAVAKLSPVDHTKLPLLLGHEMAVYESVSVTNEDQLPF